MVWNLNYTPSYHTTLNPQVQSLIGGVDEGLASQISFDQAKNQYVFNASGKNAKTPAPTDLHSLQVGADPQNPADTYSADLPTDPTQGFTYYNNHLQLSFTLLPQFPMGPAQETQGRIVYPMENGGEAIYTVKGNGLREDLIFTQPTTTANFTYQLKLPDTLQAQTKDGVIGIYSADPSLFGNISFGSDADKMKVVDARSKSAKTNLVFAIAPPTIADIHGNTVNQVNYQLSGDMLQVTAQNLSQLAYPITLDPSIVVNSTSAFALGNNEDNNIDFPANKINRGGLTGGVIGSWTATTSLPAATSNATSVSYNGYVYEIGGCPNPTCSPATAVVDYAPINANGTIGAWTATTSLPVATSVATSVAYNGYLYEIGGSTTVVTAVVDYAQINADGSIGNWTATTSLPVATDSATSVVYNGFIYEIGGFTTVITAVVDYAPIHADGTLGAWAATTSLPVATDNSTSAVYNGYLYEMGGCGTPCPKLVFEFAPINSTGTVGAWAATTDLPLQSGTGLETATSAVFDGYLYLMGGHDRQGASSFTYATAWYAPINANGQVGSWAVATSLPAATESATSVAYNGYVYEIGGCAAACSPVSAVVDYAKIQPAGWVDSWTATTSLPVAIQQATSVAYNGYLYEIGGCATCLPATAVVDYALINADGTVGAWTATTSLPTATYRAASVVYNGYVYEIGGNGASVVDFAPLNANGTVGAWTATTSLPVATDQAPAVAYNGYLYVLSVGGGATAGSTTVDYVAFNSNGTLGATWSATASLPVAISGETSVVYGGDIYELGGCGAFFGACTSATTGVNYAVINANGTLGTWTATTSLPTALRQATSVAYNGYVYEIGGCGSCPTNTAVVNYAVVNANGTLGAWTATTSLPTATFSATSVVYNGYVYEIAGFTTANTAVVDYAPINNGGPGTLGAWTATTPLPVATYVATSVAYKGYLYEIGGGITALTAVVDYAQINANGTIGAWTATTPLLAATQYATSVAYNGYLYEIGGDAPSVTATVDYAPFNSNGTIGAWTATTSLPVGTDQATSVAYNGYLYEIGGAPASGTPVTTVDYAQVNANGTIGAWTATTVLPVSTDQATAVAYNGYLYEIGGCTAVTVGSCTAITATVDYAPINANGTIGSWTATTSLPLTIKNATSVAYNGYVYEIGGGDLTSTPTAVVDYAPINANGTIGAWTATTSLPVALEDATSAVYNGYVYEIGGIDISGLPVAPVYYAPLNVIPRVAHYSKLFNEGAAGGLNGWSATTALPAADQSGSTVAYNGYLYEIGGSTDGTNPITTVDYTTIGGDGTIGSWAPTTSLPVATYKATSVAYNGYLYEIGGFTTAATAVVDYAQINANGTIGSWTATTSLPVPTFVSASVVYNGYLYEIGGWVSGAGTAVVDYVQINSNGTLGSWAATTSIPFPINDHTAAAYNGYLYEIGGVSGGFPTWTVDYVAINANGTLGASWTATTNMLAASYDATSVVYNGYLYEIGGFTTVAIATVEYAPVNANGTLGTWNQTASLVQANEFAGSAVYNGYIYEAGGYNGVSVYGGVSYAPIIYPIPVGTLVSMAYTGTIPGGTASISYETAGSNALLSASAASSTIAQGNCISGSIQYIWIRVTLDDSQAGAVFADSIGTKNANATSLQINYMAHPPANQRLHGGKQFSNNVQGPLDTCHA